MLKIRHILVHALFAASVLAPPATAQWAGEWPLNETTGTTANDISGNQNHGTLKNFAGNPWVAGKFGNALQCDGVDDYVEVGIQAGLPVYDGRGTPYTVAFWVKAPAQNDKRVYSEGSTTSDRPIVTFGTGRTIRSNEDKFQVYIRNRQGRIVCEAYSNATVFDDTWHHFVFVDVSGDISMYVDGVLDSNPTYSTAPGADNFGTWDMDVASIGAVLRTNVVAHFQGLIDDLRVYNYAVTPAEINLMILGVPTLPCRASRGYYGRACGGTLDLTTTGTPSLGSTVNLTLSGGTPNARGLLLIGFGVTPLDLSIAGFAGCVAYPTFAGSLLGNIGVLDATGSRSLSFPVPSTVPVPCPLVTIQGVAISGSTLELSRAAILQLGN